MISPFYGINPAQAENTYFFPYLFQGLNDVIMSDKFTRIIILEGGRPRSEGSKQTEAGGAKKRVPHAARYRGHVGPPILGLVAPFASILLSRSVLVT